MTTKPNQEQLKVKNIVTDFYIKVKQGIALSLNKRVNKLTLNTRKRLFVVFGIMVSLVCILLITTSINGDKNDSLEKNDVITFPSIVPYDSVPKKSQGPTSK
ncbi:hypothetical protein MASR2M41_17710 [Flammeovirgaceae bacterium]